MFTITVNGKTHTVKTVTPRALYEMGPAVDMLNRINEVTQKSLNGEIDDSAPEDVKRAMDILLDWFVIFCGNKFTKDDLLDGYPADRIMTDIGVALRAAQMGVTEALTAFPMTAKPPKKTASPETETQAGAVSRWRSIRTAWTRAFRRK